MLHRWGLNVLVAGLIETAGPLTILGAQAVYLGQPVLNGLVPPERLQALVELFEDREVARAFVEFLRQGEPV
ncbi:MAG TPA: hypothetical protein VJ436_00365 [Anaerolineales bacterium]|nr:hypothetical protein [Anaerolineales bacterium]